VTAETRKLGSDGLFVAMSAIALHQVIARAAAIRASSCGSVRLRKQILRMRADPD
jgi:hypothetical protein